MLGAACMLGGCMGLTARAPTEFLDERTGISVVPLPAPLEFVQDLQRASLEVGKRPSFAYLGVVEWDRAGHVSDGLWLHIVPGMDGQPGDIHAAGALTLTLDDGPVTLPLMEAPVTGRQPFHPVPAWGQTAYFAVDPRLLGRMATSHSLVLAVRGAQGSLMSFTPVHDDRKALMDFLRARGSTPD